MALRVAAIALLFIIATPYATLLSISTTSTATISNYYQDFASCSCDLTPSLCDNFCCCDSQCTSASTWSAANQCLTTTSSIEVPCGQSTRGFGSISDLTCVYYSNRGTIGYYYKSVQASTITYPTTNMFASISTSEPNSAQTSLLTTLSLGSSYTASNQYLMTSTTSYLYVPMPGVGGICTPSLVNLTTSGTFTCRVIPTIENCAYLNVPYAGTSSICLNGACSSNSSTYTFNSSVLSGTSACQYIVTGFSLSGTLSYSSGSYSIQSPLVISTSTNPSASLNTEYAVTVSINLASANTVRSGNPGYLQGKSISMVGGIGKILNSATGNCATSAGVLTDVPFAVDRTFSCPSPSPCSNSYYIDTLGNLSLTINKYASQSIEAITASSNISLGCKAETYTLNILYSSDGWVLDPQYYIVAASLTASPTADGTDPTTKYLSLKWTFVDSSTVSNPPSNNFYSYFSYLWTPLKQKFGMN